MNQGKIIVVGAGSWGGWSAYHLQKAGWQVTLIDMKGPGHLLAGSGGKTRVIRMAYGGNTTYTDMVARAYTLWEHYEQEWEECFYHETGSLWMFRNVGPEYASLSKPLMKERGYELELLELEDAKSRYPQVNFDGITSAWYEPKVGYLEAERSCGVVKERFVESGGTYHLGKVTEIKRTGQINGLLLEDGSEIRADQYVFACGPWMRHLFPELNQLIKVSRQEVYFFEAPEDHMAPHMPIWIEFRKGEEMFYGIPDHFGQGFKMAYDERQWSLDPDRDSREVTPEILGKMRGIIEERFPALEGAPLRDHRICVYESSVDGDFIIDQVKGVTNGLMLCGSSGHGFKMGPAIGEMVANHLTNDLPLPEDLMMTRFSDTVSPKTQYQVS